MRTPIREPLLPASTAGTDDLLGFALELLTVPEEIEKNDPTPSSEREASTVVEPEAEPVVGSVLAPTLGDFKAEAAGAHRVAPPASVEKGRDARPRRERASEGRWGAFRRFAAQSAGLQLVLMVAAGVGVLVVWTFLERRSMETRVSASSADHELVESGSVRPFPKLEMHGAERVREEEVEALLEPKKPEPTLASASEAPSSERGVVVLRPGQLSDGNGHVVDVEGGPRARAPSAARARSGSADASSAGAARFFAPGGLLTGASPPRAAADAGLALQIGDRFRVRLEVGVVSSLREDVLARVVEDVVRHGRLVLSKGDVLRGTANHDDKRIFIRFRAAETGGRSLLVSAYAVDGAMPGLVARRREATVEERTRSRAAESVIGGVAAEAGAALAGAAAVGRIAERVASGAASEASDAVQLDRTWVLEVSAGRTFDVVITEARKS